MFTVHYGFYTVIRGFSIITMNPRGQQSRKSQNDWHDFQPQWWGLAVRCGWEEEGPGC